MKKLFFLVSCLLVLGSSPAWAQAGSPVVVVRIVETVGKVRIAIARGDSKPELVEFDGGFTGKDANQVAVNYQQVMAKLYAEGYVLQGTISGVGDANISRSLLFVKAPKP
jgi:hypothetical protein